MKAHEKRANFARFLFASYSYSKQGKNARIGKKESVKTRKRENKEEIVEKVCFKHYTFLKKCGIIKG